MVYALQRTLNTFVPTTSYREAEETFEALLGYQQDYSILARQFIDTAYAGELARLTDNCESYMQFLLRYHQFNTNMVATGQAPGPPVPRWTSTTASRALPGAAAPATRPAASQGGVGPCTSRGARPTSSSPVSAAASSTPRGWPAAAQSSQAPAASTSRGWAVPAKSLPSPAPPGAAARPVPSTAPSASQPYTPNPSSNLKGKGKDKSSDGPPKHTTQKGGVYHYKGGAGGARKGTGPY